ncbi:DUF2844 domain-containing protein [Paraburkholderia phenazinium]|nr:DUF2844 domain-containing protein [Paraburkholderia phenazinium]
MRTSMLCAAAVMTALAAGIPAHAELGSAPTWPASSAGQATRLVQHVSTASVPYTVNETTLNGGTVVREYVAQNNAVFAVVWHGPQMAPLNTLLGRYFPEYLQGISAARAAQGGGHGPAMVQEDGLIVQTGGHMGNFTGRAYLPQALPQGTSPDDLQ